MNLAVGTKTTDRQMSSISSLHTTRSLQLTASQESSVYRLQGSACEVSGLFSLWLGRGVRLHLEEAKEGGRPRRGAGGTGPASSSICPTPTARISGAPSFLEKHLRKGQGWSWHGEFLLEKPRDAGAEWGRECYHRNLISLHTLSAPHLFLD